MTIIIIIIIIIMIIMKMIMIMTMTTTTTKTTHTTFPPQNVQLVDSFWKFFLVVKNNGKEIYKIVFCTCKVFLDLLLLFFTVLVVFTVSFAL